MRKGKVTGAEQVLTTPHPAVKLLNGTTPAAATTLHRDGLSSVRAITSAAGVKIESALYKPFGEQSEWVLPGNAAPETKGWIGERFDADAGLQYLNAKYYDPELALFLQPDWFEVTLPGVGANRFSYAFNDPVNGTDKNGNFLDRDLYDLTVALARELSRPGPFRPEAVVEEVLGTKLVARSAGPVIILAIGIVLLSAKPAGENSDRPGTGSVLTDGMMKEGWYIDSQGRLISPSGEAFEGGASQGVPNYTSQAEFNKARYSRGSQGERDTFTQIEAEKIASAKGWVKDGNMSERSGKVVYKTEFGYAVIDKSHGQFEYHDKKGKHLGQYDIEGKKTKPEERKYDLKV